MPERIYLLENRLHLQLDGVNDQSTGVLVLRRERVTIAQEDINMDGLVDVLDVQLWVNVFSGVETNPGVVERADVDENGGIDEKDLHFILSAILQ